MKKIQSFCFTFLICVITSFILITISSRSSFLYPMNNWDDANCFLTVAKGMLDGQVLYRDIFDHKGPYLYIIYMLANLISRDSFFGVYIIEIVFNSIFLFSAYLIMNLYCNRGISLLFTPVIGASIYSTISFYWGGSAEEILLPFLSISLYIALKYIENIEVHLAIKEIFLLGIFTGIVSLIKINLLGFFFGLMLMLLLDHIIKKDRLIIPMITYFFGIFIALIPCFFYFFINHALVDFFDNYIILNAFNYAKTDSNAFVLADRCYWIMKYFLWDLQENTSYFIWIVFSCVSCFLMPKRSIIQHFFVPVCVFFTFVGIYISGSTLKYYALPLCVFSAIGIGVFLKMFETLLHKLLSNSVQISKLFYVFSVLLFLGFSLIYTYNVSGNVYFMSVHSEDLFLYKFKKIIENSENPTLLNYNCLDAGLFTVCDIAPSCKWFQRVNVNIDEMLNEQEQYIKNGVTDYVLTRDEYPDYISEQYTLISQEKTSFPDSSHMYFLFKKTFEK